MRIQIDNSSSKYQVWDITYSHLKNLLLIKKKNAKSAIRNMKRYGAFILKHIYKTEKRLKLEIALLEREVKRRDDYPDYRTFCELFVVGINEKTEKGYNRRTVRHDINFLISFAGWCEDHSMMVQSRKLMRLIDSIKARARETKYQAKEGII